MSITKSIVLTLLIASLLSGCMSFVRTTTTTFYVPDHNKRGSIYVVSASAEANNSLEFKHYKERFEHKLVAAGYSIAKNTNDAQFIAIVSYGIDTGRTSIVSTPIFGQTSGGTTYSSGTVYGYGSSASYSGTSYTMPTYGIVGTATGSVQVYTRAIAMDIVDAQSLKTETPNKIYEIRAKSTGSCSVIAEVFDEMLEAMFKKFPGESGKSITIEIPLDTN